MGWPDGHTIVANWNGKGNAPTTPRYHGEADGLAGWPHNLDNVAFVKAGRAQTVDGDRSGSSLIVLAPLGLDSHRYRCCGNGVVAPVAEWLGLRLMQAITTPAEPAEAAKGYVPVPESGGKSAGSAAAAVHTRS